MTAMAMPVEKLSKLIPLLSSDKDGEVVAAVAAITRTLKAAGHDWHDFNKFVCDPVGARQAQRESTHQKRQETPRQERPKWNGRPPPEAGDHWKDLDYEARLEMLDRASKSNRCSTWERDFASDMYNRLTKNSEYEVSPKQEAILNRIYEKLHKGKR